MKYNALDPIHHTMVLTGVGFVVGIVTAIAALGSPYYSGGIMMAFYMFLISPIFYAVIGLIGGYIFVTVAKLNQKKSIKPEHANASSGMVTEMRR